MFPISFGPFTALGSGRKSMNPGLAVEGFQLAIDPAPAKGLVQGLGIADRWDAAYFFKETNPYFVCRSMVFLQPSGPGLGILEIFKFGHGRAHFPFSSFMGSR